MKKAATNSKKAVKALSINPPWCDLILLPDGDPNAKRVENRAANTSHRGQLLIHAEGHIVGACELVGSFELYPSATKLTGLVVNGKPPYLNLPGEAFREWPWLANHKYVTGPWCYVLHSPRRLKTPVFCRAMPGLWVPDRQVLQAVARSL